MYALIKKYIAVRMVFLIFQFSLFPAASAGDVNHESNYASEIMGVSGAAFVIDRQGAKRLAKDGDIVKIGETIETMKGAAVDVAFDSEWNNTIRLDEDSQVKIGSIYPMSLKMEHGDLYANLHALPKGSSFEVVTPVATASVRGSEYRTVHRDNETNVYNFSPSKVLVNTLDLNGRPGLHPIWLEDKFSTGVHKRDRVLLRARRMNQAEIARGLKLKNPLIKRAEFLRKSGRKARIQHLRNIKISEGGSGQSPHAALPASTRLQAARAATNIQPARRRHFYTQREELRRIHRAKAARARRQ